MITVLVDVSFWAVLAAAIAYMIIGGVWYSPFVFGRAWLRESKATKEDLAGQGRTLVGSFIAAMVMAYILGYFVAATHSTTIYYGIQTGFFCWLGFVAPTQVLGVFYSGHSWKLFAIESGYLLVACLAMGAIMGTSVI